MLNQDNAGVKRWMAQLIDPSIGAQRMPSPVPVESCLYSEKTVISFQVGTSGEFAYTFGARQDGMQMHASSRDVAATAYGVITPDARFALGVANHTYNANTNFTGPSSYSECIRLTGASIRARYIGRSDAAAGIIRTCTGLSKDFTTETEANVSRIVDGMTNKVVSIPNVSYQTWYPHDISAFEFKQNTEFSGSEGTILYGIGYGLTVGTTVEIEICVNYEYVPTLANQELLGSNAQYGPSVSNGILGTVTKGLKSSMGQLTNTNKSSIISGLYNLLGGYIAGPSMLPMKALLI